ncbi:MAG: hypothetical protein NTZ07_04005 [Candidatus Woesebacteria bacterium]|nr:hypothetical protein [Candidatus Woesebacteria bacterium]
MGKKIEKKNEDISKYTGVIKAHPITIFSLKENIIPKVQIGDRGPIFQGDFSLFKRLGLQVRIKDKQIKVSASVTDYNNELVATIIDNEWKVNPNKSFDRNYSNDAFEVKDNKGKVVLQIKLTEKILQFQGILYDPKRGLSWLVAQRERDGRMDGFMEIQKPGESFSYSISPIFKYPSNLHLGEYAD